MTDDVRRVTVELESSVSKTFRVQSLAARMDYDPKEATHFTLAAALPADDDWAVGMIVGPSGSGKSRLLDAAFPDYLDAAKYKWKGESFIDDLPATASVEEISKALSAAGLGSVPSWMLPYSRLSNGQQQRAAMARALLSSDRIAFDEFSSMLDRAAARTTAMATAKAIRRANKRLVVATCHYDIAEWLEADWVFDTATSTLARGQLRRPGFDVSIYPAPRSLWPLFAQHHYLGTNLSKTARCFVGVITIGDEQRFCAWASFIPLIGKRARWRGHRQVVLPDYQGIGLGSKFIDACYAIMAKEQPGRKLYGTTSSLPLTIARSKAPHWMLHRKAGRSAGKDDPRVVKSARRATDRLTIGWTFLLDRYDPTARATSQSTYVWRGVGGRLAAHYDLPTPNYFGQLYARMVAAYAYCATAEPGDDRPTNLGGFDELVTGYWEKNGHPLPGNRESGKPGIRETGKPLDPAKATIMLTGGKDSVHALLRAIELYGAGNVQALYVDRINRSESGYEKLASKRIAEKLGVRWRMVRTVNSIKQNRTHHRISLREQLCTVLGLPCILEFGSKVVIFGLTTHTADLDVAGVTGALYTDTDDAFAIFDAAMREYGVVLDVYRHPDFGAIDEAIILKDLCENHRDLLYECCSCFTQRNFRERMHKALQEKVPTIELYGGCGSCMKCVRINAALMTYGAFDHASAIDLQKMRAHQDDRRTKFPHDHVLDILMRSADSDPKGGPTEQGPQGPQGADPPRADQGRGGRTQGPQGPRKPPKRGGSRGQGRPTPGPLVGG